MTAASSTVGVGAAVAINKVIVVNEAIVGTGAVLDIDGPVTISATMRTGAGPEGHFLVADVTSGSGGGKVGIAGSLALTIADITTNAELKAGSLTLNSAGTPRDLSLTATSIVTSTAKAKAKAEGGSTVGIGAGVAVNIVNDTTTTSIDAGAIVTGAKQVTLAATSTDTMTTYSEAGTTAPADSDAAITPDVSVSYVTVTTSSTIGSGASLTTSGSVLVSATQSAKTTTTAQADTAGSDVAIGLALALAIVDNSVTATIARNVAATGFVEVDAYGSSENDTKAVASSKGSKKQSDNGTNGDVNKKADNQLETANDQRTTNTGKTAKTENTSTPKATTGDKGGSSSTSVQVAAAVAINVITTVSEAKLADGITVTVNGFVAVKSQAATIADAVSHGETVGTGSSDGVGVAVSVNYAHITNKASTGTATINANGGLEVSATMRDTNNTRARRWDATASAWVLIERGDKLPTSGVSNGDWFDLTTKDGTNDPGVYHRETGVWVAKPAPGNGAAFPASPAADTLWRLSEHEIMAEAVAGAGKADVGVAGGVAINIVANERTLALIGAAPHICIGTYAGACTPSGGELKIIAKSNELALVDATSRVKGASSVGVGAVVATNILTSTETRAEAENTPSMVGGGAVTVDASSRREAPTTIFSGASGSDTSVAPGVALLLITSEHTVARLGSGAGTLGNATGAVKISARHEGLYGETKAKADAAGSTAVGVAIALNIVVDWITTADLARNVSGTSVDVTAVSTVVGEAHATATAGGAESGDDDADKQKKDQIDNNPNTNTKANGSDLPTAKDGKDGNGGTSAGNDKTDQQAGDKNSGGVGVAASVSLNWLIVKNTASVGANAHVTGAGAVRVSAQTSIDATAKSIGSAVSVDGSHVAAAVGVNVANVENNAKVGTHATLEGNGITVEAVTPGSAENDFIVWGLAGAGGASQENGGASVAASIGVEVVLFHTEANVGKGSQLTSQGAVTVMARNKLGLQNIALSGSASGGGAAVGGAIAVNVFPDITTIALIDSDNGANITEVDARLGTTVSAESSLEEAPAIVVPLVGALPKLSAVALAGAASTGGAAVSGSIIVNVLVITTRATIAGGARVNQHPERLASPAGGGQTVSVTAHDETSITNLAGGLNFSSSGAGVGIGIDVDVVEKQVSAAIGSSAVVSAVGTITVSATSSENFHELAIDAGVSTSNAAVDGSVIVVVLNASGNPVARASVGGTVHATAGGLAVTASDTFTTFLLAGAGAVSASSAGVAVSLIVIDRHGRVEAEILDGANLQAGGGSRSHRLCDADRGSDAHRDRRRGRQQRRRRRLGDRRHPDQPHAREHRQQRHGRPGHGRRRGARKRHDRGARPRRPARDRR